MKESLPQRMKAVVFDLPGGADQLRVSEVELPKCEEGQVLIRVVAAGVNRPDVLQRIGAYPPPPGANPRLGLEVSGVVVSTGSALDQSWLGRHVMALVNGGGYSEYVAVAAAQCMRIPVGLDFIQAASLPEVYMTVWQNVFVKGCLSAGKSILIHGGSSGIGSAAIQMAKRCGATVLVTVGQQDKAEYCKGLGADHVFLYKETDWSAESMHSTKGRGVDLVLDMVAGDYLDQDLSCLAVGGAVLLIALLGGKRATFDVSKLLFKQATIYGTTLRPQSAQFKADLAKAVEAQLLNAFAKGELQTNVKAVFTLDHVRQAHELMEAGNHFGKIVLSVSELE